MEFNDVSDIRFAFIFRVEKQAKEHTECLYLIGLLLSHEDEGDMLHINFSKLCKI
jgi:hypothetical protein